MIRNSAIACKECHATDEARCEGTETFKLLRRTSLRVRLFDAIAPLPPRRIANYDGAHTSDKRNEGESKD
jgi:hypothetical protein